jgi:hypothetical protein
MITVTNITTEKELGSTIFNITFIMDDVKYVAYIRRKDGELSLIDIAFDQNVFRSIRLSAKEDVNVQELFEYFTEHCPQTRLLFLFEMD